MKIARIESDGKISHAIVEDDSYRLISGSIFGEWRKTDTVIPHGKARLLTPTVPPQIICIGANYRKHCEECHAPIPDRPVIFFKTCNTLCNPDDAVVLPKTAPNEVDFEAELAIVIGRQAKNVSKNDALNYVLGYTCANDISARDVQLKQDKLWDRGKSFDTFCPLGPWIATGLDGNNLNLSLELNGQLMQNSKTDDMIFDIPFIIHYLSQCMTLYPGSVILTGTPFGVGMGRNPQVFLKHGDKMTVKIEGIGNLTNNVVMEK
ncbi:MAG TPA: fumarylacetoacetate hydrolase family protein [Phycisphaerae bacterium]|nr:fumarylacetoacetate hydrolase family protein [Phycisphaerae bacterium]HPS52266.1 fumarylacetoacetate hydrolase family protein [Phycisphaerae bacterium]